MALRDCLGCSLFGDLEANGTRRRHLSAANPRPAPVGRERHLAAKSRHCNAWLPALPPSILLPISSQSGPTASRVQRLRRRLPTRRPQGRAAEWGKQGGVPAPDLLIRLAALPPRSRARRVSSFFIGGGRGEGGRNVRRSPRAVGNRKLGSLGTRAPGLSAPRAARGGSLVGHHPPTSTSVTGPSERAFGPRSRTLASPHCLLLPTERTQLA